MYLRYHEQLQPIFAVRQGVNGYSWLFWVYSKWIQAFQRRKKKLTTVVLSYYTALNMTLPASLWISRHWLNGGHQHTSEYQGVYLSLAEISPPWGGAEQKRVSIPLPSLLKIHTGFHILPFISQKKIAKEMKSSPLTRICFSAFIAALDKKQLSHPVV